MPEAKAEPFIDLFDLIIDPAATSLAGSVTPADFFDPRVFDAALTGLAAPGGWETLLGDLTSIGSTGLVLPETTAAVTDAGAASAAGADPFAAFVQTLEQDWITSPFGTQVDTQLNAWAAQVDSAAVTSAGACGLICNGHDGTLDGVGTAADGQGGGLWFGNGGNGVTDSLGQGGNGGDAYVRENVQATPHAPVNANATGGAGGNGGHGGTAPGTHGGNGGNGGQGVAVGTTPGTGGAGGVGGNGGAAPGTDGGNGGDGIGTVGTPGTPGTNG